MQKIQRCKQMGFALATSTMVWSLILGVLGYAGTKINNHVKAVEQRKSDAHQDYQRECFDKDGVPRSFEWCSGLNRFNDRLVFPEVHGQVLQPPVYPTIQSAPTISPTSPQPTEMKEPGKE